MSSSPPVEFFLAIRSEVRIATSPHCVWSCLDRLQEWKPSIVSIEHLAGTTGAEGEVLRVAQRPADQTVNVLMETVRLDPPTWRVQTLVTEATRVTDGFVIYSLRQDEGSTHLVCEVVARCCISSTVLGEAAPQEFAKRVNEDTRRKLDADLASLKAMAERAP